MRKKYVNVFGLMLLALLFGGLLLAPFTSAKSNPDHITFVKLSDIEFVDESGQGISMTKGWMKDLLKVEWGYGSYTNATLVWDGEKLTVYLQDDSKHDGRWFALNEKILQKVGIDPDKVSVKLDTQAPAEVVKRLKADGKWFYFFIDHFTTRYVTFEASEGYVEYSDWGWQKYTKLIEPDPHCEECPTYLPMESIDTVNNTTLGYQYGNPIDYNVSTSYANYSSVVTGKVGNALQFEDGDNNIDLSRQHKTNLYYFSAWIRADEYPSEYTASNAYPFLIRAYNSTSTIASIYAYLTSAGKVKAIAYDFTGGGSLYASDVLTDYDTDWHFYEYIITLENDTTMTIQFYLDMQKKVEVTHTFASSIDTIGLDAIWHGLLNKPHKATIDEVREMLRIPSEEERRLFYELGRYKIPYWQGNETSLPGYLNATLFCPLDSLDTVNNVTPCYLNKSLVNATANYAENMTLVSGHMKNAINFNDVDYAEVSYQLSDTLNNSLSFAFFFKVNDTSETQELSVIKTSLGDLFYAEILNGELRVRVRNSTGTTKNIVYYSSIQANTEYFLVINFYINSTTVRGEVFLNNEKIADTTADVSITSYTLSKVTIGNYNDFWPNNALKGWVDEFLLRIDNPFTEDEVNLLYHLSRHKTATLSAPSATFDGSQFLVNVTAQLPADGGSYVLPAPLNAQGLTAIGQIGNFTFLNAGTAGEVSYTLPVSGDLSCPAGINLLAWLYDNEIYMTGAEDQFPVVATVMNLPKGVWELVNGKVVLNQIMTNYTKLIIANATGPTVVTRVSNFYADPQNNYVNLTVLSSSNRRIYFNASTLSGEKVTFTWEGRRDIYPYEVYIDGKFYLQKLADKNGVLTFTYSNWSSHTFEIKEKDPIEYGWDFGVAMVLGMIGILIIDAFIETSNLERKDNLRKVLAAMLVAMFAVFVFSLI